MGCGASKKEEKKDGAQGNARAHRPSAARSAGSASSPPGSGGQIAYLSKLEIVGGQNLPAMDTGGKSDPFVVVTFGRHVFRTKTCKKDVNPTWEQLVVFFVTAIEKNWDIFFEVYDEDRGPFDKNDFIASAQIKIELLIGGQKNLQLPLKNKKEEACGTLHIRAEVMGQTEIERLYWQYLFAMFDRDGSKTLDREELVMVLEVIGHGALVQEQDKLEALFQKADKDRSGNICSDEFFDLAKELTGGRTLPPEMTQGNELADIISQATELMQQRSPEGSEYDPGLQAGNSEDLVWYVGLLMLGLAPGHFKPTVECQQRGENPVMKMILSESHAMTPEGAAGVAHASKTERDEGTNLGATIFYQNRLTGRIEVEKIPSYVKTGMRMVYGTKPELAVGMLTKITKAQGEKNNAPKSAKNIPGFIKFHEINMDECLLSVDQYKTFNEFFYRSLKPGARPLAAKGPGVLLCPADARTNVFAEFNVCRELWVKGKTFSLKRLLGGEEDPEAQRLAGLLGENPAVCVSRLAPQDYHRFHTACGGKVLSKRMVTGHYYTVNPIAIRSTVDVFCENARCVVEIDTGEENFGVMVHIAIGATCVGSITVLKEPGATVEMGEDFGFFAFGGSTCITLYKEGSVVFAEDLVRNSMKPIETLTRVGQLLGARTPERLAEAMKGS